MSGGESDPSGDAPPRSETRGLNGLAIAFALLALAAGAAALGWLPGWCLPLCAGPALFAAAALPLIARWSPLPADPLKLAVFTLALSPPLSACLWAGWHLVFDGRVAFAACAATCAVGHLASLGRRVRKTPWSAARACIGLGGLALAVAAGFLLLRGNEPRLGEPGLARAAVAMAVDRALPPQHPWLAGEAWSHAWSADLLAAFTMRALQVAPTFAHALFTVIAALLAPLLLYLLASSLWNDARRSVVACLLALCACAPPASLALQPFLLAGPSALALGLALAGLVAASHGLRHGKRPWILLCALPLGAALCIDLASAWPAALAVVLAAISPTCDKDARPRMLLAICVACLPALIQARLLPPAASPLEDRVSTAALGGMLVWFALAVAAIALVWRGLAPERRAVVVLLAAAAVTALAGASFAPAWTDPRSALSLALFTLAVLGAGLMPSSHASKAWRVGVVGFACLVLCSFGAWRLAQAAVPLLEASKRSDKLVGETAGGLEPVSSEASAVDLRAALAFLRADPRLREDHAVLLACPVHNPYRTTRDLPEGALAACAGIALYGDTRTELVEGEPQFQPRLEELLRFFRGDSDFDPTIFPRLEHAGARAVVALVREEDFALSPALAGKLTRLGFAPWRDFRGVHLYIGPRQITARYLEEP